MILLASFPHGHETQDRAQEKVSPPPGKPRGPSRPEDRAAGSCSSSARWSSSTCTSSCGTRQTSVGAIKREADRATPTAMVPSRPLAAPRRRPAGPDRAAPATAAAPIGPPGMIDGKVGKSDTLGRVLKKSGLTAAEADEVIRALSGVFDFKTIRAGQTYRIERGPDGRVQVVRAGRQQGPDRARRARRRAARWSARPTTRRPGSRSRRSAGGSTRRCTRRSRRAARTPRWSTSSSTCSRTTSTSTTTPTTATRSASSSRRRSTTAIRTGRSARAVRYRRILAAEYAGKAGTFRTFWFRDGYFDDDGRVVREDAAQDAAQVLARVVGLRSRAHAPGAAHACARTSGIDYAAPTGTPVWAAAAA